jgi:hypothetical protein
MSWRMGSYDNGNFSGLGYIDPSDVDAKNVKLQMSHFYQSSYPSNGVYWQQGSIDKRFKVGDQSLYTMVYGENSYYQARRFFFNLCRRQVNMVAGYQRKNRKSTVTMPNLKNDGLADDYNACLRWSEDRDGFQEYFSQAFEGALDTGMTLLHLYPDYTYDPISGDLFTDQVAYNNFLIDPYWRKMDFSDCTAIWRRRWVTKGQGKALLPGQAKEIDKMMPSGIKDGRFPLQAELINLDTNVLFPYDEFHYRATREATMILDPKSGEAIEWIKEPDDDEDLMQRTLAKQPWLVIKKQQVPTVKLAIVMSSKVLYNGRNLLNIDSYPMVPLLCYHEPDIQSYAWRVQGIIRNLRDAQYLYNRRKVIELEIMESQINSGWIYPVDSVVDPKAFRQSGQGFLIPMKAGMSAEMIKRIEAPAIPQSMIELSRALSEDISKISGVNEELLGSATDDKAGILSVLRQGAGLTTLQSIFDKADYSQRLYGKIRLEAIRKNFSKGKVRSILGRDPDPRFWTASAIKYAVAVEEGNYSTTQRQMELQQLLHFKQIGMPIPDQSILNAAFITNKAEIIAEMQKTAQQQQQQQQQQSQVQQQKDSAEIMQKYSITRSNLAQEKDRMAQAQERLAKIDELEANTQYKKAEADMNLVKMMINLEDMDLANFKASFEMAESIKQNNNPRPQMPQAVGELYG